MRDESLGSGSSIGAIITRGVESLAVACIATGSDLLNQQNVFVVFSAHVEAGSDGDSLVSPAVAFFPGTREASQFMVECLAEEGFGSNHPGEMYGVPSLRIYSAHIVTASGADESLANSTGAKGSAPQQTTIGVRNFSPNDETAIAFDHTLHAYSIRNGAGLAVASGGRGDSSQLLTLASSYHWEVM